MRCFNDLCRRRRDFRGATQAASALEIALTIPLVLSVLFGIIEVGRFGLLSHSLDNTAFKLARFAIVNGTSSDTPFSTAQLEAMAQAEMASFTNASINLIVDFEPSGINEPGNQVTVTLQLPMSWIFPVFNGPDVTIEATSRMIMQS